MDSASDLFDFSLKISDVDLYYFVSVYNSASAQVGLDGQHPVFHWDFVYDHQSVMLRLFRFLYYQTYDFSGQLCLLLVFQCTFAKVHLN